MRPKKTFEIWCGEEFVCEKPTLKQARVSARYYLNPTEVFQIYESKLIEKLVFDESKIQNQVGIVSIGDVPE